MITITDKEFRLLAEYIETNYGIHLKKEKQMLVIGRLHHVLEQMGFNTFTDYYDYLIKDKSGDAATTLIDKISTNHTYFMREVDHFYFFRDEVLPYLKNTVKDKDLRIWCAASSTGEEPYTLAMIIDEFFREEKRVWDTKILATDISSSVLDTAKEGIYSNERIAALPNMWKNNYFRKHDSEKCVIADKIKKEVIFRKLNLMEKTFPFKKRLHVIFCRNVMIYFNTKTKDALIEKFYEHLEPGGYLFIGHSEWINLEKTKFRHVRPAVYRKQ